MDTESKPEQQPKQVNIKTALESRMDSIMAEWSTFETDTPVMIAKIKSYIDKIPKDYVTRLGTLVRKGIHRNDEIKVFFINESIGLARSGENHEISVVEVLDKGQFKTVTNLEPSEVNERVGANGFGALLYAALGVKLRLLRKINAENAADGVSIDDISDVVQSAEV